MNKEKYNQIIDDAYENAILQYGFQWLPATQAGTSLESRESFISRIKTDKEFSERFGLKIEERELSNKERITLAGFDYENRGGMGWNIIKETVDEDNAIPRKLIIVTYKGEKLEIYE
jgi:hypothetical protein